MSYGWKISTPKAEGMNEEILNNIDDYIKQKHYRLINSVLVIKNEKIIFEHYYNKFNANSRNNIKSIWKSILSITLGICIDKGIIKSIDEHISKYLKEFNQGEHPYHKAITIRDLLTMSSGIYWDGGVHYHCPMMMQMMRSGNWISHISDIAMENYPGNKFQYKEWDVILLSAIISNAAGKTAYEICNEFLYKPLEITSGIWSQSADNVSYTVMKGEENSDLSARDLAKIGLLFLNNGVFQGKRIVSENYVKQAIFPSTASSGYGYLWWLFDGGYACRGYGGQEVNVYPEEQLIIVIQATPSPQSKSYGDIAEQILMAIN
ncbi:serine hydrolase domain-containing protein [Inconstantimicrobium mannanitabidum]|uniref:Penicillin-binding protein n=1 Tax=Inconstantimicrobium mannanitabidum TaxID=1604901 RepID=A0ACB5RBF8_9CLOT|nr:serine hydrolase [Clostridium sp. TW13]GKX66562.1 penicillin-binding protein [Clostridium sp. TW13]